MQYSSRFAGYVKLGEVSVIVTEAAGEQDGDELLETTLKLFLWLGPKADA